MGFANLFTMLAGPGVPEAIYGSQDANAELDGMLNQPPPAPAPAMPELAPASPPPFLIPGAAQAAPGIMQEQEVQNSLRNNLLHALSGLNGGEVGKDPAADRSNWDDSVRANYLAPLLGFTKGNLKTSIEASKGFREAIDKRNEQKRVHSNDRKDLIKELSGILGNSDPNDISNVLKQQKQTLGEDREDRLGRSAEDLKVHRTKLLEQKKYDTDSRAKTQTARYEAISKDKSLDRAQKKEIADSLMKREDARIGIKRQQLQQQLIAAQNAQDWKLHDALQEQLNLVDKEDDENFERYYKIVNEADKEAITAAKASGEPVKAPTAQDKQTRIQQMQKAAGAQAPKMAPIPGVSKDKLMAILKKRGLVK